MTKELWINLPVHDVTKSRELFTKLGFALNPHVVKKFNRSSYAPPTTHLRA